MRRLPPLCAALVLPLLVAAGRAEEGVSEPVKLVRTLQFLQDSIAHGTVATDDARRKLIDLVGKRFLEADATTWLERRNADAVLLYVLNGGNPAVLKRLPKSDDDVERQRLVAAVSAYADGSRAEAQSLWAAIDISELPVGLIGPAALVKANLLFESDPKQALRFADIARLESPGTLVEEAAIRRGIEITAKLGDPARFEFYAVSYALRFPRSMYGAAFRQRFSELYLAVASKGDAGLSPRLETIVAPLDVDDRRQIYLEVARRAIVEAKMTFAKTAADSAAALSEPDTPEMSRAAFYQAAASAISGDPGGARRQLHRLNADDLQQSDRDLLNAVLRVVDQIERWPTPDLNAAPVEAEKAGDDGEPTVDAIAARSKDVMAAAAAAVAGAEK